MTFETALAATVRETRVPAWLILGKDNRRKPSGARKALAQTLYETGLTPPQISKLLGRDRTWAYRAIERPRWPGQ